LERPLLEAEVQSALLARAEGNPLYAEQFARVLTELGTLDELPDSVHGVIAARLDGLVPAEKALLQDAAIMGKVFWLGALEAIGEEDGSRRQAEELLFGLERKEFVQRARSSSVAGEAEYAFRHVLLCDVAYGQIPRAGRGEKHRRAAGWIGSLGRPDDHAEMLAHHALRALEYTRAAGRDDPALGEGARIALRGAGDHALALASYGAAARFFSAALELWPAEHDRERAELLVHAGRASFLADGTGAEQLAQGFEELRSRGDLDEAAEAAVELARIFWFRGERDAAYSYVDEAIALAGPEGGRGRAHALVARAAYHMIASENPEAIRLAREALPLTERLGMDALHIRALDVLGTARALSGDIGGLDDSKRAIALARESNTFVHLIVAEGNLRGAQFTLGDLDAASKTLATYRLDADRYGSAAELMWARGDEAYEAVLRGRWDEGARIVDELIAEADTGIAHYQESSWYARRASMKLARGDVAGASADSEEGLDRARRARDPQVLAPALAFRAIVLLARGLRGEASELASDVLALRAALVGGLLAESPAATLIEFTWLLRDLGREAELLPAVGPAPSTPWVEAARAIVDGDLARGVELVADIGAPSVEAYARLRAAEDLARAGRHEQAQDHLAPALIFFRKVGATRYIAQAEALLAASA
jgi:hypothetical protein